MKLVKSVVGLIAVSCMVAACSNADFRKTTSGVPYKIISDGKGTKIDTGDIVKFQLTQKVKDSTLSTTYGQFPRYEKVFPSQPGYDVRNIVMDVLPHAKKGDSVLIIMSMDSFIKKDPTIVQHTPFRKGDQIKTGIKILEVFKTPADAQKDIEKENMTMFNKDPKIQAQKKKDEQQIEAYLNANHIQAKRTTWGVYVQVLNPGQGPKPQPGEYALLRYTGSDLNGKVFDSNTTPGKPLFPLQIGSGGSIIGFEDGVKELSKGGKAKLYVPSVVGYGEMGSAPVIQPNQELVFEVEVVDITKTPPPPPAMPQANVDTTGKKK